MTSIQEFDPENKPTADEPLDIRWFLLTIWQGRWIVIVGVLIGLAYGINQILKFDPQYEAYMIVLPLMEPAQSGNQEIKDIATSFGFGGGVTKQLTLFDRVKITAGTVSFAQTVERRHGVIRKLYASQWNEQKQQWEPPKGRLFKLDQAIRSELGMRVWAPPDVERLATHFKSSIRFARIGGEAHQGEGYGPFYRMSYRNGDPDLARQILEAVYVESDKTVREQDRIEGLRKRNYIHNQLSKVELTEHRLVLLDILKGETTKEMLVNADVPYTAKVVEPTQISTQRLYAKTNTIGMPIVISLILSVLIIAGFSFVRRESW